MDCEKINKIIELLEYVLNRPKMYFGKDDDVEIASSFLYGVRYGICMLFDLRDSIISVWGDSVIKRGHRFSPRGVSHELKAEGLDDKQIVKELIEIEIEFWKTMREKLENKCAE